MKKKSDRGHIEVIRFLVKMGVDIRAGDDYALKAAAVNGHSELVSYLVELGANPHAENDYAVKRAMANGHQDVVRYLESLPKVTSRNHSGAPH